MNNFPVTRVKVLKEAKKYSDRVGGICSALYNVLVDFNILKDAIGRNYDYLPIFFPKFSRENAITFGASEENAYWWEYSNWKSGRMEFLDWLIEQYKNDKTNLRKLQL